MFRGRIKVTGEIADFNTFKNKDGETMVQKDGSLSFFRPEEVENVEQLGWHPASELPELKEGAIGDSKVVFAIGYDGNPVKVFYSKTNNCWVTVEGFDTIRIKWWCYPPKEE